MMILMSLLGAASLLQVALRGEMTSYLMLRAVSILCGIGDVESALAIAEKVRWNRGEE